MELPARVRPSAGEYDPYYAAYIDAVDSDDVLAALAEQRDDVLELLRTLDPAVGDHRYAPGKWTLKQVLQHVLDSERIFSVRALCIARGETQSLPGFDENAYADHATAGHRTIGDIAAELEQVRAATLGLFASLPAAAWTRTGTANGATISVRAIPWILAGHATHHVGVIRDRYLSMR